MYTLKPLLKRLIIEVRRQRRISARTKVVTLSPPNETKGQALLAYLLLPFLLKDKSLVPTSHTNLVESLLIADVLLSLGYQVDVIDFENDAFVPRKQYDLMISARKYFHRYAQRVGDDCLKIAHLDVSH